MDVQDQFNYNQGRINYELVEVDKKVIEALKMIVEFLKKLKELPPLANELKKVDFSSIEALLVRAQDTSKKVADIKPPGCEPPTYPN